MTQFQYLQQTIRLDASASEGYGRSEAVGAQNTSYVLTPRIPHPNNMLNYAKWSDDAEASIAINVLTGISTGVGFHTKMDEGIEPEHANKKKIDEFCERVNLYEDLQQIQRTELTKGFCPVQILSDYDLHILPAETFYIWRTITGEIIRYTQERSYGDIIRSWELPDWQDLLKRNEKFYEKTVLEECLRMEASKPGSIKEIVLFKFCEDTSHPYGKSLLEPIGSLLDIRNQMNADIGKVMHRLGFPIPVMRTSRDKTNLETAVKERDTDEWIFIGNALKDEFEMFTIETGGSGGRALEKWIEEINMQICEGLHAPLLLYLKNATEASATVMMESVDRFAISSQQTKAKSMEKYLFEPQVGIPVPKVVWGKPTTGLEKATMTDLAMLLNTPNVANNQKQAMIKQFFPNLPEADWKAEGPPMPTAQPFMPFGNKPQPQETEQKIEFLASKMNDLDRGLEIIEANFRVGKLKLSEAVQMGTRVIEAYLKRIHGGNMAEFQAEKEIEFHRWTRRLIAKTEIPQ